MLRQQDDWSVGQNNNMFCTGSSTDVPLGRITRALADPELKLLRYASHSSTTHLGHPQRKWYVAGHGDYIPELKFLGLLKRPYNLSGGVNVKTTATPKLAS